MGEGSAKDTERRPDRQPYQRPAIAWEEGVDVASLIAGCGKVELSEASCLATGPAS